MPFPQKLILTKMQREVMQHRLSHLISFDAEDFDELFNNDLRERALDSEKLVKAADDYYRLFAACDGLMISVCLQSVEQAELLAETLEGSTFFATHVKGDGPWRHAARSAAGLLSIVLGREVEPHIDPIPHRIVAR
ncbi:hypothetical protein LU11_gp010 [Pseudomonas phage Lu11]|uniref:hypothetical protein n=1 Tax=Pseudomonas phage Lu11 TaxID=1161927 RepID=UPI00025F14E4|nr:hypothetical protein LU11_gp010 [Pseudomonas phage Lu11]AFH14541.1 hypothetical protein Lu11_0010 [Pseudomonas phage Lu11]